MNAHKVVPHVVDGDARNVSFDLLAERVGEASKAADLHAHGQVLTFDVAGRDVLGVGVACSDFLLAANALWRRVAAVFFGPFVAVALYENPVVNFGLKRAMDRVEVQPVPVRAQLNAVRHSLREIVNEVVGRAIVATADTPCADQLGIGIHRDPRPDVTGERVALPNFGRYVLLLGIAEAPNLIALNPFALKVYKGFVHVLTACRAQLNQQFRNRVFGNSGHANRRTDRVTFDQRCNHLCLFLGVQPIHYDPL